MKYRASLSIPTHILKELNAFLQRKRAHPTAPDVVYNKTVEFSDGAQADIKLVNANPPYVDPVLFDEDGFEMAVGAPHARTFNGVYIFDVDDNTYIVKVF